MIEKEHNYKYCNFKIIIRSGKGRAKLDNQICFDIEGEEHDSIKNELECLVQKYLFKIWNQSSLNNADRLVLLGLSQIPREFAVNLIHKIEAYSNKWAQEARVRFGITGVISEGKPGSPNYQIESLDEKEKITFYFNGDLFNALHFGDDHITRPFSKEELSQIWSIE
ncbi:hypothetical protein N8878_01565 [Psychromonas sp.]|nr:hypothetical protein [Psychromonas sp.]